MSMRNGRSIWSSVWRNWTWNIFTAQIIIMSWPWWRRLTMGWLSVWHVDKHCHRSMSWRNKTFLWVDDQQINVVSYELAGTKLSKHLDHSAMLQLMSVARCCCKFAEAERQCRYRFLWCSFTYGCWQSIKVLCWNGKRMLKKTISATCSEQSLSRTSLSETWLEPKQTMTVVSQSTSDLVGRCENLLDVQGVLPMDMHFALSQM